MMLHEAVMLEIYRQALTASELTSPRCQSRESNISSVAIDAGRCPSNGSHSSGGGGGGTGNGNGNERSTTPAPTTTTTTTTSPPAAGLPLPATLAPAAAAALLPPQSAAMAAYFNAAAAANHHLLLTNPLAAAASLVQQAAQQRHSPTTAAAENRTAATPNSTQAGAASEQPALDFSTTGRRSGRGNVAGAAQQSDDEDGYGDDDAAQLEGVDDDGDDDDDDDMADAGVDADGNSPLDLSVGGGRKRGTAACDADDVDDQQQLQMPARKMLRTHATTTSQHSNNNNYKTLTPTALPPPPPSSTAVVGNWLPPINPYLAAVAAAASISPPKSPLSPHEWSGKHKLLPNEATKALEKMTEMTRLGSATDSAELPTPHTHTHRSQGQQQGGHATGTTASTGGGRHSAWQSHWLNKGADAVRDVFKCVWCKQSFPTLASLTVHMKETQHCGVGIPQSGGATNSHQLSSGNIAGNNQTAQSPTHHLLRHAAASGTSTTTGGGGGGNSTSITNSATATGTVSSIATNNNNNNNHNNHHNKSDLNLLIKDAMPLPRKLVRGQDVWLGKGAEQTREILKCMWCGQSFRSLAEMTAHMQETQHYTNIISQEQIISWKSSDDKHSNSGSSVGSGGSGGNGGGGGSTHSTATSPVVTTPPTGGSGNYLPNSPHAHHSNSGGVAISSPSSLSAASSTVSAVLTCKVCDQAFATLKELSNHMMKNSHYSEQIMRGAGVGNAGASEHTLPAATSVSSAAASRRGRQMREKRKKSLPVRKLLEMERQQQQHDYKNSLDPALKPLRDFAAISTKITCEKCGEKVETAYFVEHLRLCVARSMGMSEILRPTTSNMSNMSSNMNVMNPFEPMTSPQTPQTPHSRQGDGRQTADSIASYASSSARPELFSALPKELGGGGGGLSGGEKGGSCSSSAPSVLNALEQLIEKSFDTRSRHNNNSSNNSHAAPAAGGSGGSQRSTPLGSSILRRLGIDDTVDYTKPLLDPQTMHFMRSYSSYSSRDRSASESSSISERCQSNRLESYTPERNLSSGSVNAAALLSPPSPAPPQPSRLTPEEQKVSAAQMQAIEQQRTDVERAERDESVARAEENAAAATGELLNIKTEPLEANDEHDSQEQQNMLNEAEQNRSPPNSAELSTQKISVKKEFNMTDEEQREAEEMEHQSNSVSSPPNYNRRQQQTASDARPISPSASERSNTPKSTTSSTAAADKRYTALPTPTTTTNAGSSLTALSSMFDNLNNMSSTDVASANKAGGGASESFVSALETNNNNTTTKKGNANPLAALQKLCETTEKSPASSALQKTRRRSSSSSTSNASNGNSLSANGLMAFNWASAACNDAAAVDAMIKCTQCEAGFSTKGAYRHHFAKVHYNNNNNNNNNNSSKELDADIKSPMSSNSPKSSIASPKSNASRSPVGAGGVGGGTMAAPIINPFSESSQSKFLKYSELAKQLSSKNA